MESITLGPYTNLQVNTRRHTKAHRFILRWDGRSIKITVPFGATQKDLLNFIYTNEPGILKLIKAHPPATDFPSDTLQILGKTYTLKRDPLRRKGIWVENDILWIGGQTQSIEKWLIGQAHEFFYDYSHEIARPLNRHIKQVKILNMKSRWGSCHTDQTLKYNWRLMLAPLEVAQYVAVHEVCHLVEMNHSPAFWKLVQEYCPRFKVYKSWLRREGKYLLAFDLNSLTIRLE